MNLRNLLRREQTISEAEPVRQDQVMQLLRLAMAERDASEAADEDIDKPSAEYWRAKTEYWKAYKASTPAERRAADEALKRGDALIVEQAADERAQAEKPAAENGRPPRGAAPSRDTCECGKNHSPRAHGMEYRVGDLRGLSGGPSMRGQAAEKTITARRMTCEDVQGIRERVARDLTWDEKTLWEKFTSVLTGRANDISESAWERAFVSDRGDLTPTQQEHWTYWDQQMDAAERAAGQQAHEQERLR